MAYTGFFADDDLYEVAKDGDPSDGTWVLPVADGRRVSRRRVRHAHRPAHRPGRARPPRQGQLRVPPLRPRPPAQRQLLHARGAHPLRGQARPRRAARHSTTTHPSTAARRHHRGAAKILDLTICEPALGSGAFLNEAINQLTAEYLKRRQAELGETLDPERYHRELQKVKAHFALHQTYGVDLNATAVELAEVSLWLNCMHPGLKAPWFGLQLRRGNSLIGCRRATWTDEPARRPAVGEDQEGRGAAARRPQAAEARSTPTRSTTSSCPATAGRRSPTARKPRSFATGRGRGATGRGAKRSSPPRRRATRSACTALAPAWRTMWARPPSSAIRSSSRACAARSTCTAH